MATQSIWATQSIFATQSQWATQSIYSTQSIWATQSIWSTQSQWATQSIYATQSQWATQSLSSSYFSGSFASASMLFVNRYSTFIAGITGSTATFTGHLSAASKAFQIPHPSKEGMVLQYGSLESPYHGIRLTGTITGAIQEVSIDLPDYIRDLVHESDTNVQLTPMGSFYPLFVKSVDVPNNRFTIGVGDRATASFYWTFTAVRKDIPKLEVES
jgi:hypothetical protein